MIRFHCLRQPFNDKIGIHCGEKKPDGTWSAATSITMTALKTGEVSPGPFMELDYTDGQQLMDELWNAGVRPSDSRDLSGQISAMKAHMSDLRRLVFKSADEPKSEGEW